VAYPDSIANPFVPELPELYLIEDALTNGPKCLIVALKDPRVPLLPECPDREEDQGVETLPELMRDAVRPATNR
jgi:hypothetical protein